MKERVFPRITTDGALKEPQKGPGGLFKKGSLKRPEVCYKCFL
jgi:hypothetical protein